jgi:hypothetical protein
MENPHPPTPSPLQWRGGVRVVLFALLLLIYVSPARAQDGDLWIDTTQPQGSINPLVYGANYGPWALVPSAVLPFVAESGVTFLRFPAGNWGDDNDITEQQLDLFMLQVRGWGVEPSVSVRMEGGTPEAAAALVRYANVEKSYDIRYWSIGNEPDLYPDYTPERANREWRAIAEAMEAVDPTILLIGPELSQFPTTPEGTDYLNIRREWLRAFLEANGDLVDIVSIHRYPFPPTNSSPATTIDQLRENAAEWDGLILNLRTVILETMGHDMPMAVTETSSHWNIVAGGEATPDSFYHAIWWADVLGRMIRGGVSAVNYFTLASAPDNAYGLLGRTQPHPTYYVYPLYQQLGDQLVASGSDVGDVTITAALDGDVLTFLVINRGNLPLDLPLLLDGAPLTGTADAWRLDATHNADSIGTIALDTDTLLNLPPQSATVYRIGS